MRLGISGYLSQPEQYQDTFANAARAGFAVAFTSLHLPEERPEHAGTGAAAIARAAADHGLELVADVSPRTPALLRKADAWAWLARSGFTRVRIDSGFTPPEIGEISRHLPVAINASTLRATDAAECARAAHSGTLGIHNYYPKPWTGLDLDSVATTAREYSSVHRR